MFNENKKDQVKNTIPSSLKSKPPADNFANPTNNFQKIPSAPMNVQYFSSGMEIDNAPRDVETRSGKNVPSGGQNPMPASA